MVFRSDTAGQPAPLRRPRFTRPAALTLGAALQTSVEARVMLARIAGLIARMPRRRRPGAVAKLLGIHKATGDLLADLDGTRGPVPLSDIVDDAMGTLGLAGGPQQ